VRSVEATVIVLATLLTDVGFDPMPGHAVPGIFVVVSTQWLAVVSSVYVLGNVITTEASVAMVAGVAQTIPLVVVLAFIRSSRT
jgi:hypothetical protein